MDLTGEMKINTYMLIIRLQEKKKKIQGIFLKTRIGMLIAAAEQLGGNQEDRLQRGNLLQTVIYQKGQKHHDTVSRG